MSQREYFSLIVPHLPRVETRCAEKMAARLDPDVFAVFRADLAHLKGGAHLAVELVLLLRHTDVVLGRGLDRPAQVRVHGATVRKQVAEKKKKKMTYASRLYFSGG